MRFRAGEGEPVQYLDSGNTEPTEPEKRSLGGLSAFVGLVMLLTAGTAKSFPTTSPLHSGDAPDARQAAAQPFLDCRIVSALPDSRTGKYALVIRTETNMYSTPDPGVRREPVMFVQHPPFATWTDAGRFMTDPKEDPQVEAAQRVTQPNAGTWNVLVSAPHGDDREDVFVVDATKTADGWMGVGTLSCGSYDRRGPSMDDDAVAQAAYSSSVDLSPFQARVYQPWFH